jgi:hypothetical protein
MKRKIKVSKGKIPIPKEIGIGAATLMRFEQGQAIDAKTFLLILKWCTDNGAPLSNE